jgi:glucokinase
MATLQSSVSVIVGTGLGGGVIEAGRVVHGVAGMAGELGHIWLPALLHASCLRKHRG